MAPRADDADSSKGNSMADRDKKNGFYTQRQYQAREYKPANQGYQPKETRYNTLGKKPDKPRQAPKPAPKRERKHRPMRKYYQLNKCYVMMSENKVTQYTYRPYRPAPHQPTYRQRPLRPVDHSMDRKPYRFRGYYRLHSVNFGYAFVTRPYDREPLTAKLPSQVDKEDRPETAASHRSVATPEKVRVHEDTGPAHAPTGGVAVLPPVLTAAPRPLPAPRPARDLSTKTLDKNGFYKAREYQYTERRFRWDAHKYREYRYRDPDYYFVYNNSKPIGQRIERRDRNTPRTIKPRPEKREKAQAPVVAAAARPVAAAPPPKREPTPKEAVQRVEEYPEPEPRYMTAAPAIMPETPREVYRAPEPKKEYFSPSPEPLPPVETVARVPEPRRQRTPTPKFPTPTPSPVLTPRPVAAAVATTQAVTPPRHRTPSPIRTPTPVPRVATPKRASPVPSPRRASLKHSGGGNTAAITAAVIGGAAVGAVGASAVAQSKPAKQPTPKPRIKTPPPPSPPPPAAAPVVAAAAVGAAVGVAVAASQPPPAKTAPPPPPPPAANPEAKPSSKPAKNKKPFVPVAAVVVDASPMAAQPPPPAPKKLPPTAPAPAPEVPTARPSPPPMVPVVVAAPAPAAAAPKSQPPPAAKAPPAPPVQNPAAGPASLGSILRTMEIFG